MERLFYPADSKLYMKQNCYQSQILITLNTFTSRSLTACDTTYKSWRVVKNGLIGIQMLVLFYVRNILGVFGFSMTKNTDAFSSTKNTLP